MQITPKTSFEYEVKEENDEKYVVVKKFNGDETEVVVPDKIDGLPVREIAFMAFYRCAELRSMTIPESVTKMNYSPEGCKSLAAIHCDSRNRNYKSVDGVLFRKDGKTLVAFPPAFSGEYVIPESVTVVHYHAFEDCAGLTAVTIPNGVTKIREFAFAGCTGLTSVTLPESVTVIEGNAFGGCTGLTSVVLPQSVKLLGGHAFCGNTGLTHVVIPKGITYLDDSFRFCSNLASIEIPEGVKEIGVDALEYSALSHVTIPESVQRIRAFAFNHCNLTQVVLSEGVRAIEQGAFQCTKLTSVTIPKGVMRIGNRVFGCCESLTRIECDPQNPKFQSIDGVLFSKDGKTLVAFPGGFSGEYVLPEGVTTIYGRAFYGCKGLTGITLPEGLKTIEWSSFERLYRFNLRHASQRTGIN